MFPWIYKCLPVAHDSSRCVTPYVTQAWLTGGIERTCAWWTLPGISTSSMFIQMCKSSYSFWKSAHSSWHIHKSVNNVFLLMLYFLYNICMLYLFFFKVQHTYTHPCTFFSFSLLEPYVRDKFSSHRSFAVASFGNLLIIILSNQTAVTSVSHFIENVPLRDTLE